MLVDLDCFNNLSAVVDVVYNPLKTKIVQKALTKGIKAVSGLYMLVGQAIKSQEIWQEKEIDKEIIDEIYLELDKKTTSFAMPEFDIVVTPKFELITDIIINLKLYCYDGKCNVHSSSSGSNRSGSRARFCRKWCSR